MEGLVLVCNFLGINKQIWFGFLWECRTSEGHWQVIRTGYLSILNYYIFENALFLKKEYQCIKSPTKILVMGKGGA